MSLILRHKPEVIRTQLDAHGWADVNALPAGIGKKYPINRDILEEIVRSDSKQRYAFNEDRTLIRANQGHSIQVDVGLTVTEPPEALYHGTAQRFSGSIGAQGLLPESRLYVHRSPDQETAEKVGRRHGVPVIYPVNAGQMHRDGSLFYLSSDGVWLTKELKLYKAFIDGLVERKDSMTARWVKGDGFPQTDDNKAKNDLFAALTPAQREVLAEILQDEHIAGIHDALAYINEMMDLDGLELYQDGESYPNDYFESLHYDFISRCDGDEWPE